MKLKLKSNFSKKNSNSKPKVGSSMLNSSPTHKVKKSGDLKTIIGKGTKIEGKITIESSGRIDGTIKGELVASNTIVIGEEGVVNGDVVSETIIVGGKIVGNIYATNRIVLEPKSTLKGDLVAPRVTISEGSVFNGSCKMLKSKEIVVDKKSSQMKVVDLTPEEILTSQ